MIFDTLVTNDGFILSILTMTVSIYSGFLPMFKKQSWRVISAFFIGVLFDAYMWLLYSKKPGVYPLACPIITSILSLLFILACIFIFKPRDIVKRSKLGKTIIKLTEKADEKFPLCIFGGDLDFFGNVQKPNIKSDGFIRNIRQKLKKDYNSNIETNGQMQQILNMRFSNVQILCTKPTSDLEDEPTRIRYGYIAEKLDKKVVFKFIHDSAECEDPSICACSNCHYKAKCKKPQQECPQLKLLSDQLAYNPDTQLRGRIITQIGNKAKEVILTTTVTKKKEYRIREYGLSSKSDKQKLDWVLYDNIWNIWWNRCQTDDNFINDCVDEYKKYVSS